jgi:dihydroflavonol-4-reductase
MTTLVTGATGFLGGHVARQLVARGEKNVRVLVRPASDQRALAGLAVERVTGDLRDSASLDRALAGVDHLYHVAADYRLWARDPREIYESNVTGTRNLMAAARRAGVARIVYTSTVATIAVPKGSSLPDERTEARVTDMVGAYKKSKFLAEQEVLAAAREGLPVVIVNPTTPIGPGDWKPTPTGKIVVDFLNGRMPAYVDTGLNFVAVEDAAAGHLLAAEHGQVGERYLLGGENLSLRALLDGLAQVSGRPAPRFRVPIAVAFAAAYADSVIARLSGRDPQIPIDGVRIARHSMFVDCGKAGRELGFAPEPVVAAMGRAVRWYEDNGYVAESRAERLQRAHAA